MKELELIEFPSMVSLVVGQVPIASHRSQEAGIHLQRDNRLRASGEISIDHLTQRRDETKREPIAFDINDLQSAGFVSSSHLTSLASRALPSAARRRRAFG